MRRIYVELSERQHACLRHLQSLSGRTLKDLGAESIKLLCRKYRIDENQVARQAQQFRQHEESQHA